MKRHPWLYVMIFGWLGPLSASGEEPNDVAFFEAKVRPLLAEHCLECHASDTGGENGALILDSSAGIAAGGSRGPLLDPLSPDDSLLLRVVRYADADLQMPPTGKLPAAELAVLERWVHQGAPVPDYRTAPQPAGAQIDYESGRQFWSFRPLARVVPPAPSNPQWAQVPLDAFVLKQLDQRQLAPNPPADRQTWLRRVTFDLTGLPPTPAEVAVFLADATPDAHERVVDRLLASPGYGERWARMWLDLARYSDLTPEWQNPTDCGWMYRDWVIRALNEDLPYAEFVRRQLAADLLPHVDAGEQAALGFLGLSPTYWKELRLAPPVIEQIVADEWDERIDAVSRTFLGLTVACARCHDHKFDPIATEDYYALAGVFASTQLDQRPLLPDDEARVVLMARAKVTELAEQLKLLQAQRSPVAEEIERQIAALQRHTPGYDLPGAHVVREASVFVLPDGDEMTRLEYRDGQAREVPVFRRGNPLNPGPNVARRFLPVLSSPAAMPFTQGSGRAELAAAMLADARGLLARVIVNRIWDQHFGAGLVRTTSDFGGQGERPSHPELLEYLAVELVEHAWNLKWLHRQMALSATYRQATTLRSDAYAIDPDNRLLWRMNRRRLDVEMWRDATLAVAGHLQLTIGGPSQAVDDLANRRRTVYATVAREDLHPMLRMHDFPEASAHSPRREPTTTALQQLFALNSPWIECQAERLWERLQNLPADVDRIDTCYRLLLSRAPTADELRLGQQFVVGTIDASACTHDKSESLRADRWRDYLQALLGLNEFHFID
jgi:hypothetical protein